MLALSIASKFKRNIWLPLNLLEFLLISIAFFSFFTHLLLNFITLYLIIQIKKEKKKIIIIIIRPGGLTEICGTLTKCVVTAPQTNNHPFIQTAKPQKKKKTFENTINGGRRRRRRKRKRKNRLQISVNPL